MKLLAVVIIYFPEVNLLRNNIKCFIKDVDELIIWDNTPKGTDNLYEIFSNIEVEFPGKITYMGNGTNHFIAYPLNRVVEYGLSNGYTHLLTMDQDSLFENFSAYKRYVVDLQRHLLGLNIYSPNINEKFPHNDGYKVISFSITSGSLYPVELFKYVGGFREDYSIDAVDAEFAFRAFRDKQVTTICCCRHILNQQFGCITKSKWGFCSTNYSAMRTYFIVRNHLLLWAEYSSYMPSSLKRFIIDEYILKRIIKIILFEGRKWSKLKAIGRGLWRFIFFRNAPQYPLFVNE